MNFKQARKKAEKIRRQRMLLLIYAFAVTGALLISVYNNNNVKASTPENTELSELMPEEFSEYSPVSIDENLKLNEENATDVSEPTAVFEDSSEDPQQMNQLVNSASIRTNEDVVTVAKGDSFIGILTGMGLDYAKATDIYTAYKKVFDARNLKVGQQLHITSSVDSKYNELCSIERVTIEPVNGTRYIVEQDADGKYVSRVEQDNLTTKIKSLSGIINGNLSGAMSSVGIPSVIIGNFINIFSFSVDFKRDIRVGDSFEVRYEQELAPDGSVVKNGDIVYAALTLSKEKIELYRFKDASGTVNYYDEKGMALKKNLDCKPMEFRKARVSSRFGRRLHPILKMYRNHDGVDYAAPMGTKVYASGDGVITMSKWYGGYGNYVTIRHNSEYSTGYGHLKSFAKGIRPGVRVKQGQVIAYVGNTGRSTGPHLHFEVMKNGRKVDPLKIKAATGENLQGAKLAEFKKVVAEVKNTADTEKTLAEADEIGQIIEGLDAEQPIQNNI